MSDYLKPVGVDTRNLSTRRMEDGRFRNPPTYTALGGFSSAEKWTDPAGRRYKIGGPSLESGGPTAVKGRPI
jgi:hypothetical protein